MKEEKDKKKRDMSGNLIASIFSFLLLLHQSYRKEEEYLNFQEDLNKTKICKIKRKKNNSGKEMSDDNSQDRVNIFTLI